MKDGRSCDTLGSRMKHGVQVDQVKGAISRLREKDPSPDSTAVFYNDSSNIIDDLTITTPTEDLGSDISGRAPPTGANAQPKIQCGCTCKCVVTNAATSAQTEGLVPSTGTNTQALIASKTNNTVSGSDIATAVKGTFIVCAAATEDSGIERTDDVADAAVEVANIKAAAEPPPRPETGVAGPSGGLAAAAEAAGPPPGLMTTVDGGGEASFDEAHPQAPSVGTTLQPLGQDADPRKEYATIPTERESSTAHPPASPIVHNDWPPSSKPTQATRARAEQDAKPAYQSIGGPFGSTGRRESRMRQANKFGSTTPGETADARSSSVVPQQQEYAATGQSNTRPPPGSSKSGKGRGRNPKAQAPSEQQHSGKGKGRGGGYRGKQADSWR